MRVSEWALSAIIMRTWQRGITDEGVNGEGPVPQVLADNGIRVAFELLAESVEAKTAPTACNACVLRDRATTLGAT